MQIIVYTGAICAIYTCGILPLSSLGGDGDWVVEHTPLPVIMQPSKFLIVHEARGGVDTYQSSQRLSPIQP